MANSNNNSKKTQNLLPTQKELDKFYESSLPIGSVKKAVTNTFYGLRPAQTAPLVQQTKESPGYVFFTRPQLNLSYENIIQDRFMFNLNSKDQNSVQRYVRMMLDPRLYAYSKKTIKSDLVDNKQAFITVLTNRIKVLSGFPDSVLPSHVSKAGRAGEQHAIGDGLVDIYNQFDLDATFSNLIQEPIILMMQSWTRYISRVFEGIMVPYTDFMIENEIDYNTRIYRIILDQQQKYVTKIAATGAAYPVSVPMGKLFDFDSQTAPSEQIKDINIRFKCVGMEYNESILAYEFNKVVSIFNADMEAVNKNPKGNHGMIKIPNELLTLTSHRGYPRIDIYSGQMEWWISKDILKITKKGM